MCAVSTALAPAGAQPLRVVILLADCIRLGQRLVAVGMCARRSAAADGAVVARLVGLPVDLVELLPGLEVAASTNSRFRDSVDLWRTSAVRVTCDSSGKLGGNGTAWLHGDDRDFRRRRGRRRALCFTAAEQRHGQDGEAHGGPSGESPPMLNLAQVSERPIPASPQPIAVSLEIMSVSCLLGRCSIVPADANA